MTQINQTPENTEEVVHNAVPVTTPTQLEILIKESNLPQTKAQVLLSRFNHYFAMAAAREKQLETLKVTDVTQITEMKLAGDLRKACKRDRTAIEKARKELNEDAQNEIKITNAIAKVLTALLEPLESKAGEIETFAETEAKRLKGIRQAERQAIADQFGGSGTTDLAIFTDQEWQVYLNGLKAVYEAKQKAEEEEKEKQKELEQLQERRLAQLSAFNFRLNLEPYGYDKLYAYDQQEWDQIVSTAEAYATKMERIEKRKNALVELGVRVPVLGEPVQYGKVTVMYEHIENYGVIEWAGLINDLEAELKKLATLKERQMVLVGMGFRYIAAHNTFVAPPRLAGLGVKDVPIVEVKAEEKEWQSLIDGIRKLEEESAAWIERRTKQMARIQSYGEVLGQVEGDDPDFIDYKAIKSKENGLLEIPWNISFKYPKIGAMSEEEFALLNDRMENYFRITRKWLTYVDDGNFVYDAQSRTFNNVECGIAVDIIKDVKELDIVAFNKKYKQHCEKINERFFRHKMRTEELETYGFVRVPAGFVYDKSKDGTLTVYNFPLDILDFEGAKYSDHLLAFQSWLNNLNENKAVKAAYQTTAPAGGGGTGGTGGSGTTGKIPAPRMPSYSIKPTDPETNIIPLTDSEKLEAYCSDLMAIATPEMTTPRGEQALKNTLLLRDKLIQYIMDASKALK